MTGISTLPLEEKLAKQMQQDALAAVSRSSVNTVDLTKRKAALDAAEELKWKKECEI